MKAIHFLVIAAGFAVIGLLAADVRIPAVPAPAATGVPNVKHGSAHDMSALKSDIELFRAELHALKALDRDAKAMQRELDSLRQEVAALSQQGAKMAADDAVSDLTSQTGEENLLLEEERAYDEEKRQRELSTHFAAQSVDTIWSLDAAQVVSEAVLREELVGSSVDAVECRSNLCRVEASHSDPAAADQFALMFPMQVGEALPQVRFFNEQQGDGPLITVMYLAREGYDLPAENP